MLRTDLIDSVRSTLAQAGFSVSERCDLRPISFDLVARRDRDLLILKVLTNVDALSEPIAQEIKLLCKFLEGRPLLVGLRAGTGELEDGVVYNRHDIHIVTPATLAEYVIDGSAPMVLAAPGGEGRRFCESGCPDRVGELGCGPFRIDVEIRREGVLA